MEKSNREVALAMVHKICELLLMALLVAFLTAFIVVSYLKPYLTREQPREGLQFNSFIEKVKI